MLVVHLPQYARMLVIPLYFCRYVCILFVILIMIGKIMSSVKKYKIHIVYIYIIKRKKNITMNQSYLS